MCRFAQQTFILLMENLQNVIDESFFLADFVPLNLFMLDCRRMNKVIVNLINEIKHFVTDYFKALNQKENRRLVEHQMRVKNYPIVLRTHGWTLDTESGDFPFLLCAIHVIVQQMNDADDDECVCVYFWGHSITDSSCIRKCTDKNENAMKRACEVH